VTETEGGLEKVAEVLNWRDSKLFSPAERAALEYAERITYTDRQVDDVAAEQELLEILDHVAFLLCRSVGRKLI